MSKKSSTRIAEDKPITQADIDSGRLVLRERGPSGAVLPAKQRVNMYLDSNIVKYFKNRAGARGYQTLINETLKQAITAKDIEATVRKAVREELRK